MKASAILLDVRSRIAETTPKYWDDVELLRWLDQAQKKVQSKYPHLTKIDSTTTSQAGVQKYANLSDCQSVVMVVYDGKILRPEDLENLKMMMGDDLLTNEGTPTHYCEFANQLMLTPIPLTTGKTIEIWYYYIPATIADGTDDIEVSDEYYEPLVKFTVQSALYKHEDYEAGAVFRSEADVQVSEIQESKIRDQKDGVPTINPQEDVENISDTFYDL